MTGANQITIYFIEKGRTVSPRQNTIELLAKILGEPIKNMTEHLEEESEIKGLGKFLGLFAIDEFSEPDDL